MLQPNQIFCQQDKIEDSVQENAVISKPEEILEEPKLYKVLLHNDDYTPMDFVVEILEKFFNKVNEQANLIMLEVHNKGVGSGGIYPREIAETKTDLVHKYAHECDYPLKCSLEQQT